MSTEIPYNLFKKKKSYFQNHNHLLTCCVSNVMICRQHIMYIGSCSNIIIIILLYSEKIKFTLLLSIIILVYYKIYEQQP